MDIIFGIIIRGLLADIVGINTRYYFFKLIGKQKTRSYLRGENTKEDINLISHHIINIVVGLGMIFILIYGLMQII